MEDRQTVEYFDRHQHEYSLERLSHVVSSLQVMVLPGESMVDIGCGTGNTIEMLVGDTPLKNFAGIDVSENYTRLTCGRTGSRTYHGSILDREFIASIPEKFDYALLASVLHHLVGRTRRESRALAVRAMENAMELLLPGGVLFVVEAAFSPSIVMDAVFHIKRMVAHFTPERVEIGDSWHNIGPPVVSYYSNEQLVRMAGEVGGAELIDRDIQEKRVRSFPMSILGRTNTTLLIRKRG
jgi:SAM-dependent methyltransferase